MPATLRQARPRRPAKRPTPPTHPTSSETTPSTTTASCVDFDVRKHRIITDLANNTNDLSPKGSVDAPIASLVNRINATPNYYTTSSCSGRIALFEHSSGDGRGKGGRWLLCEHNAITLSQLETALHTATTSATTTATTATAAVLRFEPFILSIACRTLPAALTLLSAALQSGCRESGIVSAHLPTRPVMLSVRCSIRMELPVVGGVAGLGGGYVGVLCERLNGKMADNMARIASFERWFESVCEGGGGGGGGCGGSGKANGEERKEAEWSEADETEDDEEGAVQRQRMEQLHQRQEERLEDEDKPAASAKEQASSQHNGHHATSTSPTHHHSSPSAQLSARHTRLHASITSLEARLDHLSSQLSPSTTASITTDAAADADDRCWCLLTPRQHAKVVRTACKTLNFNNTHRKVTPAHPHLVATLLSLSGQRAVGGVEGWVALPVNEAGERECRRWLDGGGSGGGGGVVGLCAVLGLEGGCVVPLLLHWAVSPSLLPPPSPNQRLQQSLRTFLSQLELPASTVSSLLSTTPHRWEQLGNLVLLPSDAFTQPPWPATLASLPPPLLAHFYSLLLAAFRCERLARQRPVTAGLKRVSAVEMLVGGDGWVVHRENGVVFELDVTKSMFASGNGSEKARLIQLVKQADVQGGEVIVDLYAGIGYFSLPLLVHTNVAHIHLCEHNPDTFHALTHSLTANHIPTHRYTLHPGDNRSPHLQPRLARTAHRVLLGLLPSSEDGWAVAVAALVVGGGWLHVHGNVRVGEEGEWVGGVVTGLERLLRGSEAVGEGGEGSGKRGWVVRVAHVEHVKNFAPLVKHLVADVHLGPPTAGSPTAGLSATASAGAAVGGAVDGAARYVYRSDGIGSYDRPSSSLFWSTIYPAARPAVLHSLPLGDLAAFTPTALLALPPTSSPPVSVHVCPAPSGRMDFVNKNYTYRTMPFNLFIAHVTRTATVRDEYIISPNERYYLRSLGSDPRREVADLSKSFPELGRAFRVPELLEGRGLFSSVLRVSSAGLSLWTHYDIVPNLLCHLHGVKRVTLFPPSASLALRLPPVPHSSSSPLLDLYSPASDDGWRRLGRQVILHPGDVLFIPPLWFHHVETVADGEGEGGGEGGGVAVSVNVFWRALPDAVYTGGDVYGNKDLVGGVECMRRVEDGVKQVGEMPGVYREFYLDRAVSVLQAAKTSSGDGWS